MTMTSLAMTIRAKKLGVLIRDVRQTLGKSVDECAQIMGVSIEKYDAMELGESSPSLPELELFAYNLNIPLDHFWSDVPLNQEDFSTPLVDREQFLALRQRMIGAQIRQAREEGGQSLEEVAQDLGLSADQLEAYELGQEAFDIPRLERIAASLGRPVEGFMDESSSIGSWAKQQQDFLEFQKLPPELREFVSKPVHLPYLELAQRLSEMSVDKLRAIGEGILEITL